MVRYSRGVAGAAAGGAPNARAVRPTPERQSEGAGRSALYRASGDQQCLDMRCTKTNGGGANK